MAAPRIFEMACDGSVKDGTFGGCAVAFVAPGGAIRGHWIALRREGDPTSAELQGIRAALVFVGDSLEKLAAGENWAGAEFVLSCDCMDAVDQVAIALGEGLNEYNDRVTHITHPMAREIASLLDLLGDMKIRVWLQWSPRCSSHCMDAADRWAKHASAVARVFAGTTTTQTGYF